MSTDNKALTRRWFEEVWNNRRRDLIYELSHRDAVTYGLAEGATATGIDQFMPFYDRFIATFPDIHITVEDVIAEGDKTAVRLTAQGTHTGDAMGIAPTNKRVSFSGIIMIRWKGGKIAEGWNEFDAWGMMQQLVGKSPMTVKG
jgi:steroid delta-isomerase-like uncharacterized protein